MVYAEEDYKEVYNERDDEKRKRRQRTLDQTHSAGFWEGIAVTMLLGSFIVVTVTLFAPFFTTFHMPMWGIVGTGLGMFAGFAAALRSASFRKRYVYS